MSKNLILWITSAVFLSTFGPWGAAEVQGAKLVDRIVAVVNDDIIPLSDLNYLLAPYLEKIKESGGFLVGRSLDFHLVSLRGNHLVSDHQDRVLGKR